MCGTCAFAQTTTATLSGSVTDPAKAVVPDARLAVRNVATNATRTAITDDQGRFSMSSLPPGTYELLIEKAGFKKTLVNAIVLVVGGSAVVETSLALGDVNEQVVVNSESEITLQNPGINRLVRSHQIEALPIGGRNFADFVKLSSGVVLGRENVGGGSFKPWSRWMGSTTFKP
jgi:hypothetical protein